MSSEDNSEIKMDKAPAVESEGSPVVDPVQAQEAPREKMIETAMKFLLNPQVRSSLLSQKKAFLQKKGLTEAEIDLAIDRSGTRQDVPKPVNQTPVATPPQGQVAMLPYQGAPPQQMAPYIQPPPPSRVTTWRDYAAIAVIISGVSYGVYKLCMKFIAPLLKSRREERDRMVKIEASIKELNENVAQTVKALEKSVSAIQVLLEKQDTQLGALNAEIASGKALANSRRSTDATEIKAEIASLKGLLLSRHQFPSTPQRSQIPAWQRSNDQSATKNNLSLQPAAATETTNGSTSPSPPPPLQDPPTTNGDPALDPTPTSVKGSTRDDGGEEGAPTQEIEASPEEGLNGSVDASIESQAVPVANGTA